MDGASAHDSDRTPGPSERRAARVGAAARFGDLRAMAAASAGRCPACRRGPAFRSIYALAERCPACGVRFERDPGSFLGATALAYTLAVLVVGLVAVALVRRDGLFPGLEWWLVASAVLTVALVYRPVKGWWLWCMWAAGWVHRDGEDPESGGS
jgi:uncharacterized protein (DUF983 family)